MWCTWKKEVVDSYVSKNWECLPIETITHLCGPSSNHLKQVQVDSRNVIESLEDMSHAVNTVPLKVFELQEKINVLNNKVDHVHQKMNRIEDLLCIIIKKQNDEDSQKKQPTTTKKREVSYYIYLLNYT